MANSVRLELNPAFKEADSTRKRYVVMKGSAGSGKSYSTAAHYILLLASQAGRNLVAMRKSEISNRDSTFAELCGCIYRVFGSNAENYWQINQTPMRITCRANGNQIVFRGMNDDKQREKLKSITFSNGKLTDVWLEEATEFTKEDFEIIDDRLRGELAQGLFYQIRLTFNPVSCHHWIKKNFFDCADDNVFIHESTYLDNPYIDGDYIKRMERRKIIDPDGYKVYGLGEWGHTDGLILQNYEVKELSLDHSDYDDMAIGQDFGFNHANAILTLGMKDGNIYVLSELYIREMDTMEIIREAEKAGLAKNIEMWCDSAEPDRIRMWKKAGFLAKAVSKEHGKGEKYQASQIDWLKQRKILISPTCVNTIAEINSWRWKNDESTGSFLDEPVPFFDDAMAALRYGVERWRKRKRWLY